MSTTASREKRPDSLSRRIDARIMRKAEAIAARYQIVLWREGDEWFGRGLELPFCMGDGKTVGACVRVTRRSMVLGVASILEHQETAPAPQLRHDRPPRRKAG